MKKQRTYTLEFKQKVRDLAIKEGIRAAIDAYNIPESTVRKWAKQDFKNCRTYSESFKKQVVECAVKEGIKATVEKFNISRSAIRMWTIAAGGQPKAAYTAIPKKALELAEKVGVTKAAQKTGFSYAGLYKALEREGTLEKCIGPKFRKRSKRTTCMLREGDNFYWIFRDAEKRTQRVVSEELKALLKKELELLLGE